MKIIKAKRASISPVNLVIYFLLVFGIASCGKDDEPAPKNIVKSNDKQITSFVFLLTNNPIDKNIVAIIDEENKTIIAAMPPGTGLSGLLPEIKISELASVDINTAQDFTNPVTYTITAEDGSVVKYTVTITVLLTQRQILQAILDANPDNTIDWDLQNTVDLDDLNGVSTNIDANIISLFLPDKKLAQLPKEIGQLTNLETLSSNGNNLTSIPSEIGQLINLEILSLRGNQLSSLPIEIGQLTNLQRLYLDFNQLASLPSEIDKLINLEVLSLSRNQLSSLPIEIWQLINLEYLSLSSNQLSSLPIEIGQLTNLALLYLGGNQLSSLPPEIWQLTNLESLSLGSNQLTSLPIEIGKLINLEYLSLSSNQLTSLPPEIGFLNKLRSFYLTSNNLTAIPQAIYNLLLNNPIMILEFDNGVTIGINSQKDALISIYSANPQNTLAWGVDNFPEVTFHANGNPKVITMNNKNIFKIPNNIDQLTELETLNVNNNKLESIPKSLGNISTLAVLTLHSNQLNTVPTELGQLSKLALLTLTNNPITSIPQNVCNLQTSNGGILTILTDPGEGCN